MSNNSTEDIIGTLYDMVQDARSMPLAADKCILERDRVLDLLDEVISRLPAEIKQSRTIVESRNELIAQARREAEGILQKANEQASELVSKEEIYKAAKKRAEELVAQTQERIDQIRKAGNDYMAESLRRTVLPANGFSSQYLRRRYANTRMALNRCLCCCDRLSNG